MRRSARVRAKASLLEKTNRLAEAEPIIRRAIAIREKSLGSDHPSFATGLGNLAVLLDDVNRGAEAEPLYLRAVAISEASYGPDHPEVATALENLASLKEEQSDWVAAAALYARAMPIMIGTPGEPSVHRKTVLNKNGPSLRAYARTLYHADAASRAGRAEGFKVAQWILQNEAGDALASMGVRFAKDEAKLAALVRSQQDLINARNEAYRRLDQAAGKADAKASESAQAAS